MISFLTLNLRVLFTSLLWTKHPLDLEDGATPLRFQLRHQHAVTNNSRVLFSDVAPLFVAETYNVNTRYINAHRPSSYSAFSHARLQSIMHMQNQFLPWENVRLLGPNVGSRETLLQLAKMTHNSYFDTDHPNWYDLGDAWNKVCLANPILPS